MLKQTPSLNWRRALSFISQLLGLSGEKSQSGPSGSLGSGGEKNIRVDREIAPQEAAIVRWLLDNSYIPEAAPYRHVSADSLRVLGEWTCCRSVDFTHDIAGASIISDAPVVYPDGQEAVVMLWARDGQVIALEVVDHTEATAGRLPGLPDLRTWEQRGRELANEGST